MEASQPYKTGIIEHEGKELISQHYYQKIDSAIIKRATEQDGRDTSQPFLSGDEVEAICELDLGLEMELVCNLTLKDVKDLKHQTQRKGS